VERTLKTLNGYHDDILEALRKAALQRGISTPSGSTSALSEELLRRSIKQCQDSYDYDGRRSGRGSKENICGEPQVILCLKLGSRVSGIIKEREVRTVFLTVLDFLVFFWTIA